MKTRDQNSILYFIGLITLAIVFAAQILPYSQVFSDHEHMQVFDFEGSESEEKDTEELEDEKEKYKRLGLGGDSPNYLLSAADLCFENNLPLPPFLETLSPPPDLLLI